MEPLDSLSDISEESEVFLNSSEESDSQRPNRFKGPKSTWQKFTEEERQIVTSMNQLRDRDLSVHTYNAHAMKHHYNKHKSLSERKPWANKVSLLNDLRVCKKAGC